VGIITKKGIRFCINCGKENVKLLDNRCAHCYIIINPLISKINKNPSIKICKNCFNYYDKHWIKPKSNNFEDLLSEIINSKLNSFISFPKDTNIEFKFNITPELLWTNRCFDLEIIAKRYFPEFDEELTSNLKFSVNVEFSLCNTCLRIKGGSYKAVVNITRKKQFTDDDIDEIFDIIEKDSIKLKLIDKNAFTSKYTIGRNKIKLYLNSEKFARKLSNSIINKFGGIMRESTLRKTKGENRSKKLDKLMISLKLPKFDIGDVVILDDVPHYIKSINRDQFSLLNLDTNKIQKFSMKKESKLLLLRSHEKLDKFIVICKFDDSIQIMDKKKYNIYEILKDQLNTDIENIHELSGFTYDDQIYIVPEFE